MGWGLGIPRWRNRDALDRDGLQVLLRSFRPVFIVHIDGFRAISGRVQRGARRIAGCCGREKYSYGVVARFNRGGSEIVDDGERQIRLARVGDVDGRRFIQLPDYPITRLPDYPIT